MKKINFFTTVMCMCAIPFISCVETSDLLNLEKTNSINAKAKIQFKEGQVQDILNYVDFIKDGKSLTRTDPPVESTNYRIYFDLIYLCAGTGGNCLPDIVVTPPEIVEDGITSEIAEDAWNATEVGQELNSAVASGVLSLEKNDNLGTKTNHLIYTSTETGKSMVIPLKR